MEDSGCRAQEGRGSVRKSEKSVCESVQAFLVNVREKVVLHGNQ